jgi:hypothetical protein
VAIPYVAALFGWLQALGTSRSAGRILPSGAARSARAPSAAVLGGTRAGRAIAARAGTHRAGACRRGGGIAVGAAGFVAYPAGWLQSSRRLGHELDREAMRRG